MFRGRFMFAVGDQCWVAFWAFDEMTKMFEWLNDI